MRVRERRRVMLTAVLVELHPSDQRPRRGPDGPRLRSVDSLHQVASHQLDLEHLQGVDVVHGGSLAGVSVLVHLKGVVGLVGRLECVVDKPDVALEVLWGEWGRLVLRDVLPVVESQVGVGEPLNLVHVDELDVSAAGGRLALREALLDYRRQAHLGQVGSGLQTWVPKRRSVTSEGQWIHPRGSLRASWKGNSW